VTTNSPEDVAVADAAALFRTYSLPPNLNQLYNQLRRLDHLPAEVRTVAEASLTNWRGVDEAVDYE